MVNLLTRKLVKPRQINHSLRQLALLLPQQHRSGGLGQRLE